MIKRRYLLFILIVSLFAVSAVSGAEIDNDTNMLANSGDSGLIAESVNENILDVSLNEEGIQGSVDNGTFTDLQKKINGASEGSIINLENNYTYDSGFYINSASCGAAILFDNTSEHNVIISNSIFNDNAAAQSLQICDETGEDGNPYAYLESKDGLADYQFFLGVEQDSHLDSDKKDVNFTMSVADVFIADDVVVYFNISQDIEDYDEAQGEAEIWEYENDTYTGTYPAYDGGFYFKDGAIILPVDASIFNYPLKEGHYLFSLEFYGDEVYNPKIINQTFNVYPADYNMTGNRTVIKVNDFESFSENRRLYFNLTDMNDTPLKDKVISITINGVTYNRTTDDNGCSSIAINLPNGDYSVVLSFEGDDQYLPTKEIEFIWIPSTIECDETMMKYCRDSQAFYAKFFGYDGVPLDGGNATFNINGVFYTRDIDESGRSKLNINLAQGKYIITAKNPVTGDMKSCLITVLPTITDNQDLVKYYRNDSQYVVRLQGEDTAGQKVTFNINGVFYERTSDEYGNVKLNINLEPGKYIITAEFNGCRVSNNITVLQVLNASDLKMSYKDGSTFNASLMDGQGRPYAGQTVTFNINGVFYDRITDAEGIARLNINLMAGEYIITSSYNGANIANKVTISS